MGTIRALLLTLFVMTKDAWTATASAANRPIRKRVSSRGIAADITDDTADSISTAASPVRKRQYEHDKVPHRLGDSTLGVTGPLKTFSSNVASDGATTLAEDTVASPPEVSSLVVLSSNGSDGLEAENGDTQISADNASESQFGVDAAFTQWSFRPKDCKRGTVVNGRKATWLSKKDYSGLLCDCQELCKNKGKETCTFFTWWPNGGCRHSPPNAYQVGLRSPRKTYSGYAATAKCGC